MFGSCFAGLALGHFSSLPEFFVRQCKQDLVAASLNHNNALSNWWDGSIVLRSVGKKALTFGALKTPFWQSVIFVHSQLLVDCCCFHYLPLPRILADCPKAKGILGIHWLPDLSAFPAKKQWHQKLVLKWIFDSFVHLHPCDVLVQRPHFTHWSGPLARSGNQCHPGWCSLGPASTFHWHLTIWRDHVPDVGCLDACACGAYDDVTTGTNPSWQTWILMVSYCAFLTTIQWDLPPQMCCLWEHHCPLVHPWNSPKHKVLGVDGQEPLAVMRLVGSEVWKSHQQWVLQRMAAWPPWLQAAKKHLLGQRGFPNSKDQIKGTERWWETPARAEDRSQALQEARWVHSQWPSWTCLTVACLVLMNFKASSSFGMVSWSKSQAEISRALWERLGCVILFWNAALFLSSHNQKFPWTHQQ